MDAEAAARAPERPWQAVSRTAGLTMSARLALATPLPPILAQVEELLRGLPDAAREHAAPDGSWTTVWLSQPPVGSDRNGRPTPLLDRVPGLLALAAELDSPLGLALIARMPPGCVLGWHYDPTSTDRGRTVRLHLPVRTDPAAVTDLCHERVHWPVGGLYYGDYGFPHRVLNGSGSERIHLYFDVAAETVAGRLPAAVIDPGRNTLREAAVNLMLAGGGPG